MRRTGSASSHQFHPAKNAVKLLRQLEGHHLRVLAQLLLSLRFLLLHEGFYCKTISRAEKLEVIILYKIWYGRNHDVRTVPEHSSPAEQLRPNNTQENHLKQPPPAPPAGGCQQGITSSHCSACCPAYCPGGSLLTQKVLSPVFQTALDNKAYYSKTTALTNTENDTTRHMQCNASNYFVYNKKL